MSIVEEIEQLKVQITGAPDKMTEAELTKNLLSKLSSSGSSDLSPHIERLEQLAEDLNSLKYRGWLLTFKATSKRSMGEYENAIKLGEEALTLLTEANDMPGQAAALNGLGIVYMRQANYPRALDYFNATLQIRQKLGDKEGIAWAYNNLGVVYADLTNLPEALKYGLLSLEIKKELNDQGGIAASYINIGAILQKQSKYTEALKNFQMALPIMEEIGAKMWVGDLHNNIGIVLGHLGNYPEAMKSHLKALQIREPLTDKHGIAQSYNSIADIHEVQGNYDEALSNNLRSLQLWTEIGNKHGIAQSHAGVGEIYKLQGNYDKALESHLHALVLRNEMNDKHGIVESYNSIGLIYERTGNYDEALKNHLLALELGEPLGNKRRIAFCYMGIGEVYEKQGRYSDSIKNKLHAYQVANETGSKELMRQISLSIYTTYKIMADYENALKYYEVYHNIEKETLGEESKKQLTNLSFQHNLEQKEKEAEINRLRYVELESKNQQIQQEKEEAERQRKRAEQSEHFKQMFLANMSHEIRTPMNAIAGMTNILLSGNQSKENLQYLNAIKHSSDNLLVVINDVLDISKMEAGKLNIENTAFNIEQQLYALRNIFNLKAAEKKISFVIEVAKDVPDGLVGDPHRLNQVLINLLGNAFKFTHKGKVTLSITQTSKNKYRFAVKDSGIGIAPEKLALIFESFSQAEGDTTRQYGGTGLGLTISKQLVELMGGQIQVTSTPGKGSEFSFELILKTAKKTEVPVSSKTKLQSIVKDLKGLRVLLAEDNRYNQIVSVEIIKKFMNAPDITIAETGKEVLQKLKNKDYDIILMDLHMPLMDGYEATKKIRTTFPDEKKNIPILAVTASVVQADIDRCFAVGMNGYVSKPFSPEQLLQEIQKLRSGKVQTGTRISGTPKPKNAVKNKKENTGVDTSYLENITEGNKTEMIEYIDIFMKFAPVQTQKVNEAVQSGNTKALYTALHTLKPQLQFMGVQNALENTLLLEKEVRNSEVISEKMKETATGINTEISKAVIEWGAIKEKLNSTLHGTGI